MVIQSLLTRNLIVNPGKTAVFFEDKKFTYEEFNSRVNQITNAFLNMGITKGDRIAIVSQNCYQFIELYFAAAKGGIVICPIDFRLAERETLHLLNYVKAKCLVFGEANGEMINSIRSKLKTTISYICIREACEAENNLYQYMLNYEDLVASSSFEEPNVEVHDEDLLAIFFTSGTTGFPKGVMLSHKNLAAISTNMVISLGIKPSDINIIITPLFHGAAIWPMLTHFYVGATTGTIKKFDVSTLLSSIEREGITNFNSVPTIMIRILNHPKIEDYALKSLRWVVYGGAAMPAEITKKAIKVFGDRFSFAQIYGQTESFVVCFLGTEAHRNLDSEIKRKRLMSCGRQIINAETKVVSHSGESVRAGKVGEIITRSDCVMKGYLEMPEESSEVLRNGWLYTGDLATIDDEGYIYIVDRRRDMIISGGENIYSREVEDVLYMHPAVLECAVIGIPDEEWGEAVKAVVVLKSPEGDVTEKELIEHCKKNMASFKKPKSIDFDKSLPKTASGKIKKKVLREKWANLRLE